MFSASEIKQLCKELDIWPTKTKGQNFLINKDIVKKIIETADLNKDDVVLEIGPGLGVLTNELAKRVKKVVAVELDKKLVSYLEKKFSGVNNLELVNDDIIKWLGNSRLSGGTLSVPNTTLSVVANLPYQITSRVLRLLLESDNPPTQIVVMVQKEVGERICEAPGKMSVLSIMVQYYGQPKIIKLVGKGNFWPRPKVDSVILRITTLKDPSHSTGHGAERYAERRRNKKLFEVVKLGFSSRRKMLKNNLGKIYDIKKIEKILGEMGLNLKIRAQELSVKEWVGLAKQLNS